MVRHTRGTRGQAFPAHTSCSNAGVIPEQMSPGFHWFLLAPRQLERERGKRSLPRDLHQLKSVVIVGSRIEKHGKHPGNAHWEPVIHSNMREELSIKPLESLGGFCGFFWFAFEANQP